MSYSYTLTSTTTFTVTHARHIAAKVATDLKRVQRFYGRPTDASIADYEAEIVELLKGGYIDHVFYGFKRGELWIEPTVKYTASDLDSAVDDDPGRIRPRADISGAAFSSFLVYSQAWWELSDLERQAIKSRLPFQRTGGFEPGIAGYLRQDKTYSAGGRALVRATVRAG